MTLQDWAEDSGRRFTLVTQNVDGLHQRAGSRGVLELHGSILRWRGWESGEAVGLEDRPQEAFPLRSAEGELLRPDVVWFGEALPEPVLAAALKATSTADVFFSVGTSAVVYPAAGLIDLALRSGTTTVEINPQATPMSSRMDHHLSGASGRILSELAHCL